MIECPKCKVDISDSYQGAEPDVGIMGGGWYCDACDLTVTDEDGPEPYESDVGIFGAGNGSSHKCVCGVPYEMGYGLAGGGDIGPYMYCPSCGTISQKSTESETGT